MLVISLFSYLSVGLAISVEAPDAKRALPDDFVTYVWTFVSKTSEPFDVILESTENWEIQGESKRRLSVLPDTPSYLAVTVKVPKNAKEGLYSESLSVVYGGQSYSVDTEVGFVSGLTVRADSTVSYNGESTFWSIVVNNTGNGGDVYELQVGKGDSLQRRQVTVNAGESKELQVPIDVGYQAYVINSIRDKSLKLQGLVHVQGRYGRQFRDVDESHELRTQFSTEFNSNSYAKTNLRIEGALSDYVYGQYDIFYDQQSFGTTIQPERLANHFRFEGLEVDWFVEGDIAKDNVEFAGGYRNQASSFGFSSNLLNFDSSLKVEHRFQEQQLVTGLVADFYLPEGDSDLGTLAEADRTQNVTFEDGLKLELYASQAFSNSNGFSKSGEDAPTNQTDTEDVAKDSLDLLAFQLSEFDILELSASNSVLQKADSNSTTNGSDEWISDWDGTWDLRFGVKARSFSEYDLKLKSQAAISHEDFEGRFGIAIDKLLVAPEVKLNALIDYDVLNGQLTFFPTAQTDEDYWQFLLSYDVFNTNISFELNDSGDWRLSNSQWWPIFNNFMFSVVSHVKGVKDNMSFGIDANTLAFQNTIHSFQFLPFTSFSTDTLDQAVLGLGLNSRVLFGSDTSATFYWLPFNERFGTTLNNTAYFDATKISTEIQYSFRKGEQKLGAELSLLHPFTKEKGRTVSLVASAGVNSKLSDEFVASTDADEVFIIPDLADYSNDSDLFISVGLKWQDAVEVTDSVVEFFGGRKLALLTGKVNVVGSSLPIGLRVKAGSYEFGVDANGNFSQELPEGSYALNIVPSSLPNGFFVAQKDVETFVGKDAATANRQSEVLLSVFASANIVGSINTAQTLATAISTSQGLPTVEIDLTNQFGQVLSLTSDPSGKFALDNLRPGIYDALVRVPTGWRVAQESFQFSLAAGEQNQLELDVFPVIIQQRSFQPDRLRIRDVVVEAEIVPPMSKPIIEVTVRGTATKVIVDGGNKVSKLAKQSDGMWVGRVNVPTSQGSVNYSVVAIDDTGQESRYPFFLTVEDSAVWGIVELPQVVVDGGSFEARAHWFTDDITEAQLQIVDAIYPLQGSGADWYGEIEIEIGSDEAQRLPVTFKADRDGGSTIDIKRVMIIQP